MSDRYLSWVNSNWGGRLARMFGLPQPVPLERYRSHRPTLEGEVLIGASSGGELVSTLVAIARHLGLATLAHRDLPQWTAQANAAGLMSGPWHVAGGQGARLKAMIFDASAMRALDEIPRLYQFFHEALPALQSCGRVVLLGRPPESCADPEQAAIQRGLEGLMRSIGRELRRGSTVQLVLVSQGQEAGLEGVLDFLLSPRSAYVSGQVIRITRSCGAIDVATIEAERPLAGRRILVTGASQGIGEAVVRVLARDGATVVALDVPQRETALKELVSQTGGRSLAIDLTAPDAAQLLVDAALGDGGWDGVIHNAGITRDRSMVRMARDAWDAVLAVNLQAPIVVHRALLEAEALRPGARIVVVSSISGIAGNRGQTNYAFSKAGLLGWAQAQAPLLASQDMAINAVAPGFIESAMTAAMPWTVREAGRRLNALRQGGQPVDVAEAVAWLASPAAVGVNGQTLRVCGQSLLGA